MINILSLLGACCVAAFQVNTSKALQPRQAINNAYYSVQDTFDSQGNVKYKQGNFYYDSASWGYELPSLTVGNNTCYLTGYTLFKEDDVVFNGFKYTYSSSGYYRTLPISLIEELQQESNYYCGFFDIIALWGNGVDYMMTYWYRVAFMGNLSMQSDFSVALTESLPQWNSNIGDKLSYVVPFNNFFLAKSDDYYWHAQYVSLYNSVFNNDLGVVDSIFYTNTYPSTLVGTTGVSLSFYPNSCVMFPNKPTDYIHYSVGAYQQYGLTYSNTSWSWLFNVNDTPSTLPSVTFQCDYQRTSYAEATLYHQGYSDGYSQGANAGETAGYNNGYQTGYDDGYQEGVDLDTQTASIFSGILSVGLLPVNFFLSILNFEVFGINIGAFVSATLTIAIVIIIIRLITGKKND